MEWLPIESATETLEHCLLWCLDIERGGKPTSPLRL